MTEANDVCCQKVFKEQSLLSQMLICCRATEVAVEMVEGEGFEPSKAVPADLQSDPFGHSGTPPRGRHITKKLAVVKK